MIIEFRNNFRNKTFCGVLPTSRIPVVFVQNKDMNLLLTSLFDRQIISHSVGVKVAYFVKGPLINPIQVESLDYLKNYFSESLLSKKRLKKKRLRKKQLKKKNLVDLIINKIKIFMGKFFKAIIRYGKNNILSR